MIFSARSRYQPADFVPLNLSADIIEYLINFLGRVLNSMRPFF